MRPVPQRSGQRNEQIENRVEKHRYGQHEAAGQQRGGRPALAQHAQKRPHDPISRPAVHQALADHGGQRDHDPDVTGHLPERRGHPGDLHRNLARRQQAHQNRGGDEREKGIEPEHEDHADDGHHAQEQNHQGIDHGLVLRFAVRRFARMATL